MEGRYNILVFYFLTLFGVLVYLACKWKWVRIDSYQLRNRIWVQIPLIAVAFATVSFIEISFHKTLAKGETPFIQSIRSFYVRRDPSTIHHYLPGIVYGMLPSLLVGCATSLIGHKWKPYGFVIAAFILCPALSAVMYECELILPEIASEPPMAWSLWRFLGILRHTSLIFFGGLIFTYIILKAGSEEAEIQTSNAQMRFSGIESQSMTEDKRPKI